MISSFTIKLKYNVIIIRLFVNGNSIPEFLVRKEEKTNRNTNWTQEYRFWKFLQIENNNSEVFTWYCKILIVLK